MNFERVIREAERDQTTEIMLQHKLRQMTRGSCKMKAEAELKLTQRSKDPSLP